SASRIAAGNATSVHAPGPTAGVAAVAPDDDGEPAGFDPCGEPCTPSAAVPPPDPLRRTRSTTASNDDAPRFTSWLPYTARPRNVPAPSPDPWYTSERPP